MALFKILRGDSSRISTEVTPFHDGYAYFTPDDGGLYIDADNNGEEQRIRVANTSVAYGTLYTDKWENNEQTIEIEGVTENSNGVIGIAQDISDEAASSCFEAGIYICGQGDGYVTLATIGNIPIYDIPVVLLLT